MGEAVAAEADGSCAHPFLAPSAAGDLCVLPGRVDIGRHFVGTGGVDGLKEPYEKLVSRLLSFGMYVFDLDQVPAARDLFADPKFTALAKQICPADKQHLDPFQFNFIVQVPALALKECRPSLTARGPKRSGFLLVPGACSGALQYRLPCRLRELA